jgi:hypothetical protein
MPTNNQTTGPAETLDVVTRLETMLDSWRAHVDEFLVQLDLAHMEMRDRVAHHEEAAERFANQLEERIAEFRRSLTQQRETIVGIQRDVSEAASSARER